MRWAASGPFKARPGRALRRGPFKAWPTWQPLEPRTRSEAGRWVLPVEAAAGAGADGPSAEGASEPASQPAEPPAAAMGQNDLMGTAEDFADQVRPAGPSARGAPPPRPSCWAPGLVASGPRPCPAEPAPGPRAAPRPGPGPSRCPRRARSPSPSRGPASRARRLPAPGAPPNSASGAQPALAPPARRGALGVFPGPGLRAPSSVGLSSLPDPARLVLDAEGRQRLSPRLPGRGLRPRGGMRNASGASSPFCTAGWSLHACPSTGHS